MIDKIKEKALKSARSKILLRITIACICFFWGSGKLFGAGGGFGLLGVLLFLTGLYLYAQAWTGWFGLKYYENEKTEALVKGWFAFSLLIGALFTAIIFS